MKILYITGQLALHGGIERVTTIKVNYLADHTDNEVFLSTYRQKDAPLIYPVSSRVNYEDLGIGYDVNYSTRPIYTFRQFKHVPKHLWRTYQLIRRIKPDIIIVPNFDYEFWFMPIIKRKAKIIREYHGSLNNVHSYKFFSKYWLKQKIDSFVQRHYDKVVVLTIDEIQYFDYRNNVIVIPNPIALSAVKSDLSSNQIVTIGRINPVKQFEKFIEVAFEVLKTHPYLEFNIYGEGEEDYISTLKQLVILLGLEEKVLFRGKTSNITEVLSQACLYVCTSKEESFGVTLVEAQEYGVPVVSFDCPNGPRHIIHSGVDGFLTTFNSVHECSKAITTIIEDKKLHQYMGKNSIKNAEKYHVGSIMECWDCIFKELIQN